MLILPVSQAAVLQFFWELALCHSKDFYAVIPAKVSTFIILADKDLRDLPRLKAFSVVWKCS